MRRRGFVVGLAASWGGAVFLGALTLPLGMLGSLSEPDPARRLLEIQILLGITVVSLSLGGLLAYHAASALGGSPSSKVSAAFPWPVLLLFPAFVAIGQWQASHAGWLPWLFPFVNLAMVSLPSLGIAALAVHGYQRSHRLAWPLTWREVSSAVIFGALGAIFLAGILNSAYALGGALAFVEVAGEEGGGLVERLQTLPTPVGVVYDLSVLSVFAPLNEEASKGFVVALFFYRRGGLARCFLWGVLAGAGFNISETFFNSLALFQQDEFADRTIGGQWWIFAVARAGTAAVHSAATGLAAIGFYGLFRRRWNLIAFYLAGVAIHASWNFLAYVNYGDAFLAGAAPDARWLDILSVVAMTALGLASLVLIAGLGRNLRDGGPAAVYTALGMAPRAVPAGSTPGCAVLPG